MKKILIVSDKLYPDEVGGSCTYAFETIKEFQRYNNVDIFTCYPEKENNNKVFKGEVFREFNKKRPIKSSKYLLNHINNKTYDVIIFHTVYSWVIYYLIKYFINNKPKQVAIYHGPWSKEARSKYLSKGQKIKALIIVKIMKKLEWLYACDNDNFIFLSNYMREELIKINKNINKKNYKIIPGGVNVENYIRKFSKKEARKILGIDEEKFVVFTLRRLEHRMGIQNAIKAIDNMKTKEKEKTILIIGGTGNYKNELEKLACKSDVKCIFTGFIPDEKINLYFCAADLFLVPSIELEGFGLVNLESLAMGVPVLATPQGGMKELNGKFENFYLCNEISIDAITHELNKLYYKVRGKTFIEEEIKNYSWKNISNEILKYI